MKLAIATCAHKPDLLEGDRLLVRELAQLGIEAAPLVWTDPAALEKPWDAMLVRSTWDYYKRYDEFLAWFGRAERKVPRILNAPATVRWNADKFYLRGMEAAGVACVPTLYLPMGASEEGALRQLRETGWHDVVVKPAVSGGAFLTARAPASQAAPALGAALKHSGVLVQPFLPSVAGEGEASLIFFRGERAEFSHATVKVPRRGDFRVQTDFGGVMQAFEPPPELVRVAARTLEHIPGDWVFARVDLLDWTTPRPLLGELEVLEPDLYLQHSAAAPARFANALAAKLRG